MKKGTEFVAVECPYCKGNYEIHPDKPKEERYCEWCWNGIVLKEKVETIQNRGLFYRIDAMYGYKESTEAEPSGVTLDEKMRLTDNLCELVNSKLIERGDELAIIKLEDNQRLVNACNLVYYIEILRCMGEEKFVAEIDYDLNFINNLPEIPEA